MDSNKIVIFKLNPNELWHNLKRHSQALHSHYLKKYKSSTTIYWSNLLDHSLELEIEKKFTRQNKLTIICLDPQIPVAEIIQLINKFQIEQVKLIIHGYGDFIRQIPKIKKAMQFNQSAINVTAYFPSVRTCHAFQKIFNTSVGIIKQPIIYDSLPHKSSQLPFLELKKKTRKAGYIGRIEQSKNIIETIELLRMAHFFDHGEFFLAGEVDPHHYNYDQKHIHNDFILNLTKYIKNLEPEISSKIHFLGYLKQSELTFFIKKMDVMISLSTFYGECFGISIRQIVELNAPIILSDWGGYVDIQKSKKIKLLKVAPQRKGLRRFNSLEFEKKLTELLAPKRNLNKSSKRRSNNLIFSQKTFKLKKISIPNERVWNMAMAGLD